ncbi:MAG: efflux RND transporter periplasmic adaptor subunit [SAR324 cluster bacterium]|nr:efflux RND transporter periplasmic adaptor subunit [SAR324 cluster bacterium]
MRVSSVGTEALKIESTFVGYLLPNERVRMTSEMEGVIEAVNFEEADEVKKGQKLINISTKELTLRVKIAEANLKLAQTNLSRDEKLSQRKLIPQSKLDQTRTQADRSLLDRDLALINLRKSVINSPLKGTVKIRHVKVGEFVRKGDPLVEILDLDKVLVQVNIPEQDIMKIREGETVGVELYALSDQQYRGKVQTIGLEADSRNRTFPIEIVVDNPKRELRPGMLARVTFTKQISDEQVVVPRHSILERDAGRVVFLVEQDKAVKQSIVTGQSMQDRVQVLEGLKPGDRLVVEGHSKLTDGETVSIVK